MAIISSNSAKTLRCGSACGDTRLTGVLAVTTAFNKAVAKSSVQEPPANIGIDRFEFWLLPSAVRTDSISR